MHRDNALIYTALVSLGVQTAAAESLGKSYDSAEGISPEVYARGAAEAFFYGKGNFSEAELRNGKGLSPILTELQRSTAYRLVQIMNDSLRRKTAFGVERNEFTARLDPKLVSAVDALAKLFHIKVRFDDLGGNNGLYHPDTGLIELDIAPQHRGASNAFLFSVSHELGHAVKARIGSTAWNEFAQYAVRAKGGEDAVKAKQESAAEYSEYSVAREEVVCDFIGELLSEQTALDNLCASIKSGAVKLETARGIVAAWRKVLDIFKGKDAQQTDAETAALVKRVQEQFGVDIKTAENAVKKLQKAMSAALQAERSSNDKTRTAKASDKDAVDRETSMGYDKSSIVERSAEDGYDRGRRTADISREVPSSSETAQGNSNQFRGTQDIDRRGDRSAGKESRGQKVSVFQYQTATPYQRARIEELISLAFDASEEWRYYLLVSPDIDITSEVMRMYEEGDPRLRGLEETVPGLSEALYEVEAFIRQTTAQQTETAAQSAEQRGDTSLSEASDSEGNRLTKAQRDYFKDSVFRDREGRLLVLYHGSHFESFSVFELFRGIWMTTDKAYAETYAEFRDESEPLDREVYTDEALKLYKLYAKAERPANLGEIDGELTEERLRGLAESLHIDYRTLENLFGYDIGKNATFAVTRTERFIQLAREQGFDSFTATESGVPTYCVFADQNQVALTTNEAPTEHRDIRYSKKDLLDGDGTTATKANDTVTARETVEAEASQNKQAETAALSDYGTQNDLSHEQHADQEQPTVHSLLMDMDVSKVKNATERKYLKEYQETATRQLAEQQNLDKLQAELDALPKDNRQTSRARFLRDEIIKTKNRLQICQSIQTRLETDSPLTYLIHREIKPRLVLVEVQKATMPQTEAKTTALPSGRNSEERAKPVQGKRSGIPSIDLERRSEQEQLPSSGVAKADNDGIINSTASYQKVERTLPYSSQTSAEKKDNKSVREWYIEQASKIPALIDKTLPVEEQAKQAFEARNEIRTEARKMMVDEETRKKLDKERPNKTFEELVESKMKRKGMTREEAILDILKTATKTNSDVNKELGVGGE